MAQETLERFDPAKEFPLITYGLPFPEACAHHLTQTLHRKRPFLVVSNSLNRNTDTVERLQVVLNNNNNDDDDDVQIAGIHIGMQPHTYYSDVLRILEEVRDAEADAIITVGGGSLIDGAKVVALALANNITSHDNLDLLLRTSNHLRRAGPPPAVEVGSEGSTTQITIHPPTLPILSITTTLSAGEFNAAGGATNDETKHKQLFFPPNGRGISVIILDPLLTTTTPERVWLSTGLRAVDHCVETIAGSNPNADGTESSLRGLRRLIPGLLRAKQNPGDLEARLQCQLGSADSMRASQIYGVHVGGSHGIGHQLGPIGVPHAETTCVCLPAVQKYNARVNAEQQEILLEKGFWADPVITDTLTKRGLVRGRADLGDVLDAVIRELGLPRTLKDYGIGRDQLDRIAESSIRDACCQWNVIPLERKEQVLEILEMCLGDQ